MLNIAQVFRKYVAVTNFLSLTGQHHRPQHLLLTKEKGNTIVLDFSLRHASLKRLLKKGLCHEKSTSGLFPQKPSASGPLIHA